MREGRERERKREREKEGKTEQISVSSGTNVTQVGTDTDPFVASNTLLVDADVPRFSAVLPAFCLFFLRSDRTMYRSSSRSVSKMPSALSDAHSNMAVFFASLTMTEGPSQCAVSRSTGVASPPRPPSATSPAAAKFVTMNSRLRSFRSNSSHLRSATLSFAVLRPRAGASVLNASARNWLHDDFGPTSARSPPRDTASSRARCSLAALSVLPNDVRDRCFVPRPAMAFSIDTALSVRWPTPSDRDKGK